MFRFLCSLLLVFFVGCATATPNFLTKQGLFVQTNNHEVSKAQVELGIDLLVDYLANKIYPGDEVTKERLYNILSVTDYTVKIESDIILCPTIKEPFRTCQGIHNGDLATIKYVHRKELYDTALIHELLHLFKYHLEGNADGGHTDIFMWEIACQNTYSSEKVRIMCEMKSAEGFTNSMLRGVIENGKEE